LPSRIIAASGHSPPQAPHAMAGYDKGRSLTQGCALSLWWTVAARALLPLPGPTHVPGRAPRDRPLGKSHRSRSVARSHRDLRTPVKKINAVTAVRGTGVVPGTARGVLSSLSNGAFAPCRRELLSLSRVYVFGGIAPRSLQFVSARSEMTNDPVRALGHCGLCAVRGRLF
jgi:hypothetical protein